MDKNDDFVLVPKGHVEDLKKQIKELKERLKKEEEKNHDFQKADELIQKIEDVLETKEKQEEKVINEKLTEIKDLNKSTLNNLILKSEKLENKLDDFFSNMKKLNKTDTNSTMKDFLNVLEDMSVKLDFVGKFMKERDVSYNIQEILTFMKNLKILFKNMNTTTYSPTPNYNLNT